MMKTNVILSLVLCCAGAQAGESDPVVPLFDQRFDALTHNPLVINVQVKTPIVPVETVGPNPNAKQLFYVVPMAIISSAGSSKTYFETKQPIHYVNGKAIYIK